MIKEFYYIDSKEEIFFITLKDFPKGPLPVIWHNQGMYNLVPLSIVVNAIGFLKDIKKIFAHGETDYGFIWSEARPIPQEIGDQLTNKQFEHQTNSDES